MSKLGGRQVASSVTQIWYSLRLSEEDFQLVIRTLRELTEASSLEELTGEAMKMDKGEFQKLSYVWRKWLQLSSREGGWITEARIIVLHETKTPQDLYLAAIPMDHKESASNWFAEGILLPKESRRQLPRENFTLTGSDFTQSRNKGDFEYKLKASALPFSGWDYKDVRQWCHSASVLKMYSEYVSHVLEKCALKLATEQVKFHFLLCDCKEIASFLPPYRKYDRITTSNTADYVPLTNLLDTCKPLLNLSNASSVIITEFINWVELTNLKEEADRLATSMPLVDRFRRKVLEDTGNGAIAFSKEYRAFVEYLDRSAEFIKFLRASLQIFEDGLNLRRTWKSLANHNGLIARDFLRCQNQVFPARWMMNGRRVTKMNGFERTVEWTLEVIPAK